MADACHRAGLKLGWYYSPRDWYHDDFATARHDRYLDFYHGQLRELCTNYGQVDILWFDGLDSCRASLEDTPEQSFQMLRTAAAALYSTTAAACPATTTRPSSASAGSIGTGRGRPA